MQHIKQPITRFIIRLWRGPATSYQKEILPGNSHNNSPQHHNTTTIDAEKSNPEGDSYIDLLCFASALYLIIPSAIFLFYFAPWPFFTSIAFSAVIGSTTHRYLADIDALKIPKFRTGQLINLFFALMLTWISGILPPFAENIDWYKHYAIFDSLTNNQWPPILITVEGPYVLRYCLSYYIIPSLAAKAFGATHLSYLIYLWTALGYFLVLSLAFNSRSTCLKAVFYGLIFLLFSGADILGYLHTGFMVTGIKYHLEWWAKVGELASVITNAIWTPQHALAGWIISFLIWRYPKWSLPHSFVLLASTATWSPLVLVGICPILLFTAWQSGLRHIISWSNIVFGPALLMITISYLLNGSEGIPKHLIWNVESFSAADWILFICLEFGFVVTALLFICNQNRLLLCYIACTLLTLCVFYVGHWNDLLMRGSIPAIGILAVLSSHAIVDSPLQWRKAPLAILLIFGLVTPINEIRRAVTEKRIQQERRVSISDIINESPYLAPQYAIPIDPSSSALKFTTVLNLEDISFTTFGQAKFNLDQLVISSDKQTDAALVSEWLNLPPGVYRIKASLDYDVESQSEEQHAAHISLHGVRLLNKIPQSAGINQLFEVYFKKDSDACQLSFGLGGWSTGKGVIQIRDLQISFVHIENPN
ncbi:hypothetical protein [Calycomorphotria hydatis]|uniref:Uncharacterized protein n=1 Tax=Calycomorphotria hydatis TaxID=2528027 RepID=A0A517T7D3_9PLAN|nr:hypothetical protein [Calycomorphotria hydatis]QDT64277.1 hypothetical protein V22_15090 [Calycomorphotria hydatis]